jgi:hypothetical protein
MGNLLFAQRLTQAVSTDRVLAQFCHSSVAVSLTGNYPRIDTLHLRRQSTTHAAQISGLERAGDLLRFQHRQLVISKRKLRQADAIQMVRQKREGEAQNLGFSSRPFVLCGLPVKRPPNGCLLPERRNGRFVLQVTGHPSYGLPWGQDRLVPIFLATMAVRQQSARITFNNAAEMLDTFGIQQGGSQYPRLVASFQRIFGATIFFGTDIQRDLAAVVHCARFNFMTEARIWYSRDLEQALLPGDCQNVKSVSSVQIGEPSAKAAARIGQSSGSRDANRFRASVSKSA